MSRKPSPWIAHVKAYASKNSISYKQAMQSPECKSSYTKTGGSILGKIKDSFKKAGKDLKKGAKATGDFLKNDVAPDVQKAYGTVNQYALKNDWGGKIQMVKNAIPQQVTTLILTDALMAAGVDPVASGAMAGSATGALYSVDFSRSLKGQGKNAEQGALQGGLSGGTQSYVKNRQSNKNKVGSGFASNIILNENKMKKTIERITKKLGGSVVGSGVSDETALEKLADDMRRENNGNHYCNTPAERKKAGLPYTHSDGRVYTDPVGGSFKRGGDIKTTPTYYANHQGLNSQQWDKYEWDKNHGGHYPPSSYLDYPFKRGGSFRGSGCNHYAIGSHDKC